MRLPTLWECIPLLLPALIVSFCIAPVLFGQTTSAVQAPPQSKSPQIAGVPSPVGPPPARAQTAAYNCEPVNPDATPEARALLKKLCALSGQMSCEKASAPTEPISMEWIAATIASRGGGKKSAC
ncbi:MAG: hypothetical protein JXA73_21170 [Acidobacteria bacterium]|nr:hypothetical protein [Acidobacteriota bacterium]